MSHSVHARHFAHNANTYSTSNHNLNEIKIFVLMSSPRLLEMKLFHILIRDDGLSGKLALYTRRNYSTRTKYHTFIGRRNNVNVTENNSKVVFFCYE